MKKLFCSFQPTKAKDWDFIQVLSKLNADQTAKGPQQPALYESSSVT